MIPWLVLALGAPPVGLDLDAGERWEAHGDDILFGPPGCFEVVGRASWNHDFGAFGGTRGDAVFAGRVDDGVWGSFRVTSLGEQNRHPVWGTSREFSPEVRFTPLFGQVRGLAVGLDGDRDLYVRRSRDPKVEPVNTALDVVGKLRSDVSTWWVTWDEERGGVMLHRSVEAGKKASELEIRVLFPDGGDEPTWWDMKLDDTYRHPGWIPARVTELVATVRGRRSRHGVLPDSERMKFTLRLPLLTVRAAQTIRYTAVLPCRED